MTNESKHEIISFRRYSIDLRLYTESLTNRLKADEKRKPEMFRKGEIDEMVKAMELRIRNQSSQRTDSSDNGTT